MNGIRIEIAQIEKLETDAVVNAANERLAEGGGVCGAIFKAAKAGRKRNFRMLTRMP